MWENIKELIWWVVIYGLFLCFAYYMCFVNPSIASGMWHFWDEGCNPPYP